MKTDNIISFPFLTGKRFLYNDNKILFVNLESINFDHRFIRKIKTYFQKYSLIDLLNLYPNDVLTFSNFGRGTLIHIQKKIVDFLLNNNFILLKSSYSFFANSKYANDIFPEEILNEKIEVLKIHSIIKQYLNKDIILNYVSDLLSSNHEDLFNFNIINLDKIDNLKSNIHEILLNLSQGKPQFPLLYNCKYKEEVLNEDVFLKPISLLNLNQKTLAIINNLSNIKTVYDLLFVPPEIFSQFKNFGRKSICKLQNLVIESLFSSSNNYNYKSNYLDDIICENLNRFLKNKRNVEIFLKYYGYYSRRYTLEEIGQKYNFTRERTRQITNYIKKNFASQYLICNKLIDLLNNISNTTKISNFFNELNKKELWHKHNEYFLKNILHMIETKSFNFKIINDYIVINKEYEITSYVSTK